MYKFKDGGHVEFAIMEIYAIYRNLQNPRNLEIVFGQTWLIDIIYSRNTWTRKWRNIGGSIVLEINGRIHKFKNGGHVEFATTEIYEIYKEQDWILESIKRERENVEFIIKNQGRNNCLVMIKFHAERDGELEW